MAISEDRFVFVPVEVAGNPPEGLIEHFKDWWWVVHPKKGLAFFEGRLAQCNTNESIVRRLASEHPWAEVRFIPSVFRRIDPNDYV